MMKVRANKDVLGAVMVAAVVISLYSFWGTHILTNQSGEPASVVANRS